MPSQKVKADELGLFHDTFKLKKVILNQGHQWNWSVSSSALRWIVHGLVSNAANIISFNTLCDLQRIQSLSLKLKKNLRKHGKNDMGHQLACVF